MLSDHESPAGWCDNFNNSHVVQGDISCGFRARTSAFKISSQEIHRPPTMLAGAAITDQTEVFKMKLPMNDYKKYTCVLVVTIHFFQCFFLNWLPTVIKVTRVLKGIYYVNDYNTRHKIRVCFVKWRHTLPSTLLLHSSLNQCPMLINTDQSTGIDLKYFSMPIEKNWWSLILLLVTWHHRTSMDIAASIMLYQCLSVTNYQGQNGMFVPCGGHTGLLSGSLHTSCVWQSQGKITVNE